MAIYVGLDLGTNLGWANMHVSKGAGTALISGTWNCSIKAGHDAPSLRFTKFERQLSDLLSIGCDMLFYELVRRHNGVQAAHIYGAFVSKMQEVCDAHGVPYVGIGVGTIKKFATGKGNASKDDVIRAVRMWGYSPKDDNEADAIALVRCGWEQHGA